MYPSAVIFDFDGVIVDTEPLHYRAFQKILAPKGLGFSWDDYVETYMGYDDRDAFRAVYLQAEFELADAALVQLIARKADAFQEIIAEGITAYPGVIQLITRLHQQGIPLAISSGALLTDIKPILKMLKLDHYFAHIVTADDVTQSKPDPASYQLAANKLLSSFANKISSIETMRAIEDTPAGIASAKGAGLSVIAVTNSYPTEKLSEADHIVASLEQLLAGF